MLNGTLCGILLRVRLGKDTLRVVDLRGVWRRRERKVVLATKPRWLTHSTNCAAAAISMCSAFAVGWDMIHDLQISIEGMINACLEPWTPMYSFMPTLFSVVCAHTKSFLDRLKMRNDLLTNWPWSSGVVQSLSRYIARRAITNESRRLCSTKTNVGVLLEAYSGNVVVVGWPEDVKWFVDKLGRFCAGRSKLVSR